MSESTPETESTEATGGDTNVEAENVVVNNAEDGGGVDNNAEPTGDAQSDDSE